MPVDDPKPNPHKASVAKKLLGAYPRKKGVRLTAEEVSALVIGFDLSRWLDVAIREYESGEFEPDPPHAYFG